MTTAAELRTLAEEVEKLAGPSEEMDALIVAALNSASVRRYPPTDDFGPKNRWQFWSTDGSHFLGSEHKFPVKPFTSSIDAAASLMPDGKWRLSSEFNEVRWCAYAARWDPRPYIIAEALAATEPLARCAAALRARAAVIEAGAKAETVEG